MGLTDIRFELLGVPLLGEEVGVLTMMKASESLMSFLSFSHLPEDSKDRRIADLIRQCFVSACNIYQMCSQCRCSLQISRHDSSPVHPPTYWRHIASLTKRSWRTCAGLGVLCCWGSFYRPGSEGLLRTSHGTGVCTYAIPQYTYSDTELEKHMGSETRRTVDRMSAATVERACYVIQQTFIGRFLYSNWLVTRQHDVCVAIDLD